MFRFALISALVAVSLAGCGGSGSKAKLTESQKQEFASTLESAGRSQKVAENAQRNSSAPRTLVVVPSPSAEEQMAAKLNGSCDFETIVPKGFDGGTVGFPTGPQQQGIAVNGPRCPIQFKFLVTTTLSQTSMSLAMDLAYSVADGGYKALNDIFGMTLKGEFNANKTSGEGEFKGTMSSHKHGEIPFGMQMSGTENKIEIIYTWDLPSIPVEIKVVQNKGSQDPEIAMNGERMTVKQFQELIAKGGGAFTKMTEGAHSPQAE